MTRLRSQSWKATEVGFEPQSASRCPLQGTAKVMENGPGGNPPEAAACQPSPHIYLPYGKV